MVASRAADMSASSPDPPACSTVISSVCSQMYPLRSSLLRGAGVGAAAAAAAAECVCVKESQGEGVALSTGLPEAHRRWPRDASLQTGPPTHETPAHSTHPPTHPFSP